MGRARGGGRRVAGGTGPVSLLTDRALHGVGAVVGGVVLGQRGEQGEAHLADTTHKGLLLHLHTLVLQEVRGLVEDLHTLGALERPVLADHALVLMWVCEMGDIVPAGPAFMASLVAYLQGGLLGLGWVLLLTVLSPAMATVLLAVLTVLQSWGVWLKHNAVHGTAQGVLGAWRDGMDDRRWSDSVLLPGLRHAGPCVGIQLAGCWEPTRV